ncbi:hypothetical protein PIB30_083661 [Stylosanthes scabra]|uniref:Uncharacterized protein n=1 Tax=Stylosanthes scabra TaxID=79078 RepID=A0ABU6ZQY4_9FABA|nr:hypothetical protein [Stylosanthes scabra]
MARNGKEIASASTPSRARSTKNSNRGRGETFPADRLDNQIHYDRWRALERRGYVQERIIHLPKEEPDFLRAHVLGLGWGFMYNPLVRINVTMVRVFYPGVDDAFEAAVKVYKEGNLNMIDFFRVIGREDTNWADDPAVGTIPNPLDHAILNAHTSAWHKVIMVNVDPKTHGTTFDMSHALLIYVLMTEGVVSLPRIMRDILLTRPMKLSRHVLPYPVFIPRLASECRVPEYPWDEFYTVREVEMYCPYGDWKGEQPRIHRGRLVPPRQPPQDQQEVGEIAPSSELPDREDVAYDMPGIPRDRFHWLGAYLF